MVPLDYSSSFAKQASILFRQACSWACLTNDVLCVVDSRKLYKELIVVDPLRPRVRHPELILHVDKSRSTTVRSSTVDVSVSLV